MDDFIDILAELLCNLNFSKGFHDIRKKTENKFLRFVLYVLHCAGVLLLGLILAAVIFALFKAAGAVFGLLV